LSINLVFELTDGTLLSLQLTFELSNFFPLGFDKGVQTAGLSVAFIAGTFPGDLRSSCTSWQNHEHEEEKNSDAAGPEQYPYRRIFLNSLHPCVMVVHGRPSFLSS
jgi:hypothetical protein